MVFFKYSSFLIFYHFIFTKNFRLNCIGAVAVQIDFALKIVRVQHKYFITWSFILPLFASTQTWTVKLNSLRNNIVEKYLKNEGTETRLTLFTFFSNSKLLQLLYCKSILEKVYICAILSHLIGFFCGVMVDGKQKRCSKGS